MEEIIIGACREVLLRQKHARRSTLEPIIQKPLGIRIIFPLGGNYEGDVNFSI